MWGWAGVAHYNHPLTQSIVTHRRGVGSVFLPWGKGLKAVAMGWNLKEKTVNTQKSNSPVSRAPGIPYSQLYRKPEILDSLVSQILEILDSLVSQIPMILDSLLSQIEGKLAWR